MADITITAASVALVSGQKATVTAGGTVTAGMPVYRAADGHYEAARGNAATTDAVEFMSLNGASDGQPLSVALPGAVVNMGATLSLAKVYVLSETAAGGVAPVDDVLTTTYVTVLGVAQTTANMLFQPAVSSALAAAAVL
jgi:hypothetical protein